MGGLLGLMGLAWAVGGAGVGALVAGVGLVVGVVAMGVYWGISPQGRLKAIKGEVVEARRAMRAYKGTDASEMMRLSKRSVGLATKQLGLVMGPTVVAVLPVLLVLWGLARHFGSWEGTWEWWFMGGMTVSAIFMKVVLKIE